MTDYLVFGGIAVYLFTMDLIMNRKQEMTTARAATWSVLYVIVALIFAGYVWVMRGPTDAQLFLTAYTLEKVLSVDNLIVFSAVFSYFGIKYQHRYRILRWGIIGAATMRMAFVYGGTGLFNNFERWMSFAFAALIIYSAYFIMLSDDNEPVDHASRWYTRCLKRFWPLATGQSAEGKFFIRCYYFDQPARAYWCMTPGLMALVAIEVSDVVFAVDSVPTVIAVARDPFIVYSSMIFAILGLRAMYFILDSLKSTLRFMNFTVGIALCFVAAKLVFQGFGKHLPPTASLVVVGVILSVGVAASLIWRKDGKEVTERQV